MQLQITLAAHTIVLGKHIYCVQCSVYTLRIQSYQYYATYTIWKLKNMSQLRRFATIF